jgi:hypothetical protein
MSKRLDGLSEIDMDLLDSSTRWVELCGRSEVEVEVEARAVHSAIHV